MAWIRWSAAIVAAWTAGCGDNYGVMSDAAVDAMPDSNPLTPATLAETGLCTDPACTTFAADVFEYAPRFELWSDTATKRRWFRLPPGTQIDTSDMNYWVFPVGTKLWKQFTRDGTRVETRYIVKLVADDNAPSAWYFASYEWNAAQDATTLASPPSGVDNANGTGHDIPSRSQCKRCHDGLKPSRVLGFGAVQLDQGGMGAPTGLLDLEDAIAMNLLSAPPTAGSFAVPGDAVAQAALGYLHANCGHCHNPTSATYDLTTLDLRLDTTKLGTVEATPSYLTAVDVPGTLNGLTDPIIKPDDVTGSVMIIRMTAATYPPKMPEVGTEIVDPDGQAALAAWINAL